MLQLCLRRRTRLLGKNKRTRLANVEVSAEKTGVRKRPSLRAFSEFDSVFFCEQNLIQFWKFERNCFWSKLSPNFCVMSNSETCPNIFRFGKIWSVLIKLYLINTQAYHHTTKRKLIILPIFLFFYQQHAGFVASNPTRACLLAIICKWTCNTNSL